MDLSINSDVTAVGWTSFAAVLQNPNSALEAIDLGGNSIGDYTLVLLLNSLAHNNKVKELLLDDLKEDITVIGWDALSKFLCNKSSIDATFNSNHTLQSISQCPEAMDDEDNIPDDVKASLALNGSSEDKREVAIKKILKHHQHFDMQPFFEWDLKVVPIAVHWLERARSIQNIDEVGVGRHKLGVIYQFVRAMPEVFEPAPAEG